MSEAAKFHAIPSLVDNAHTDQIKRKSRTVKYKLKHLISQNLINIYNAR